jgi:hypothetical protein
MSHSRNQRTAVTGAILGRHRNLCSENSYSAQPKNSSSFWNNPSSTAVLKIKLDFGIFYPIDLKPIENSFTQQNCKKEAKVLKAQSTGWGKE